MATTIFTDRLRQGDTVVVDEAMERSFFRKLMPGDPNRKWDTIIVVSDNEPGLLPRSMKRGELGLAVGEAIAS